MAKKVAQYRLYLAQHVHLLKDGRTKMDLASRPFQERILADDATDIVIYGSSQWGKTEVLICHAAACAGVCGLNVMWVSSTAQKRNKFVADRINPAFGTVPMYKKMFEQAQSRSAKSDSTGLKHFGDGSINFVYATSEREFTSYAIDVGVIDEHQDCHQENIRMIESRMAGSDWGFMMRVGHPDVDGSDERQNLDYLFKNSDQRLWKVPCPTCRAEIEIDWWQHVVHEERNKYGGILNVRPRDEEWKPGSVLDMRPICDECHRPMNRLSPHGFWQPQKPGHVRHGYNLGNIYNPAPTNRLGKLFEMYLLARHSPGLMSEFVNKFLGKCWSLNAEKISQDMIAACASGQAGVAPYRFHPASIVNWKRNDENPKGVLVP